MTLQGDRRGQSLWWVLVWLIGILLALWIFALLFGAVLEPIADVATGMAAVDGTHETTINLVMQTLTIAGMALGVFAILLTIIFAVWNERFLGQRRRMP